MNVTDKMKRIAITSIASLGLISPIVLSSFAPAVSANSRPSVIRISQNKVSNGNYTKQIKYLQRRVNAMNSIIKKDKNVETKRSAVAIKNRIKRNIKAAKGYQAKKNAKGATALAKRIKNNRKELTNIKESDASRQAYANRVLREYKQLTKRNSRHANKSNASTIKPIRHGYTISLKAHQRNLQRYINDMNLSIRKDQRYLQHRNRVAALRKRRAASHARYVRARNVHIRHLQMIATKLHAKLSRLNKEVKQPSYAKKRVAIHKRNNRKAKNIGLIRVGAKTKKHSVRKARNTGIVKDTKKSARHVHHGSYVRLIKPNHSTNRRRISIKRTSSKARVRKYRRVIRHRVPKHESKADRFFDSLDMAPSKDMNIDTGAFAYHKAQPVKSYSGNWEPYSVYRKSLRRAHNKKAKLARRRAARRKFKESKKYTKRHKSSKYNKHVNKSHKRTHDTKLIKKRK